MTLKNAAISRPHARNHPFLWPIQNSGKETLDGIKFYLIPPLNSGQVPLSLDAAAVRPALAVDATLYRRRHRSCLQEMLEKPWLLWPPLPAASPFLANSRCYVSSLLECPPGVFADDIGAEVCLNVTLCIPSSGILTGYVC